jgi:hypothetical protein
MIDRIKFEIADIPDQEGPGWGDLEDLDLSVFRTSS